MGSGWSHCFKTNSVAPVDGGAENGRRVNLTPAPSSSSLGRSIPEAWPVAENDENGDQIGQVQNGNDFRTNVAQNSPSPRAIVPEAWTTPGEVRTSSDELNSGNNETKGECGNSIDQLQKSNGFKTDEAQTSTQFGILPGARTPSTTVEAFTGNQDEIIDNHEYLVQDNKTLQTEEAETNQVQPINNQIQDEIINNHKYLVQDGKSLQTEEDETNQVQPINNQIQIGNGLGNGFMISVLVTTSDANRIYEIAAQSDMTLDILRTRVMNWRVDCGELHFIIKNRPLPHEKESSYRIMDVLPKLFTGSLPSEKFTFSHVKYRTLTYSADDFTTEVLCSMIVQMAPFERANLGFCIYPTYTKNLPVDNHDMMLLYESSALGDESQVSQILMKWPPESKHYFNKNEDQRKATPLHFAAENGHLDVCNLLLETFTSEMVDIPDYKGETAIYKALNRRRLAVVAYLISRSSESVANGMDTDFQKLLSNCCDKDWLELGNLIPASVFTTLPSLSRPVILASMKTHLTDSIREHPWNHALINDRDHLGWTLLHHAVTYDNQELVEILVNHGAEMHPDMLGFTPLVLACLQDRKEMISKLLRREAVEDEVSLALEKCILYGKVHCANELLCAVQNRCNLNERAWLCIIQAIHEDTRKYINLLRLCPPSGTISPKLQPFLLVAAALGDDLTLNELLNRHLLDVNFQDYMGQTALHEASRDGHMSTVNILISQQGIDINIQNRRGESPLHYAARAGKQEIVSVLLQQEKINVNLQDSCGRTPVLSSLHWGRTGIFLQFLSNERHRECFNLADYSGISILHFASLIPERILADLSNTVKIRVPESPITVQHNPVLNDSLDAIYGFHDSVKRRKCHVQNNKIPPRIQRILQKCPSIICKDCGICSCMLCRRGQCCLKEKKPKRSKQKMIGREIVYPQSESPLHIAVQKKSLKAVEVLAHEGGDLLVEDKHGRNALELAVDMLDFGMVAALIGKYQELDVSLPLGYINDLLERCLRASDFSENVKNRKKLVLDEILILGRKIGFTDRVISPVALAIKLDLRECVSELLQATGDYSTTSALITAIESGNLEIIREILEFLVMSLGQENLCSCLRDIHDEEGLDVLGIIVKAGGTNVMAIAKLVLQYCPYVNTLCKKRLEFEPHTFQSTGLSGQMIVCDCRGNTIIELITMQNCHTETEKNTLDELGSMLIEGYGAAAGIFEGPENMIIHSSCCALRSSIQQGFWRMASKLLAMGAGRQAWKCSSLTEETGCQRGIGLIMDDLIHHLCKANEQDELLTILLLDGIFLEQNGELAPSPTWQIDDVRTFWLNYAYKNEAFEIIYKKPEFMASSTVENSILLAIHPIVVWKGYTTIEKGTGRRSSSNLLNEKYDGALNSKDRSESESGDDISDVTLPGFEMSRSSSTDGLPPVSNDRTSPRLILVKPAKKRCMSARSSALSRLHHLDTAEPPESPNIMFINTPVQDKSHISGILQRNNLAGYSYMSSHKGPIHLNVDIQDNEREVLSKLKKTFIRKYPCKDVLTSIASILHLQPQISSKIISLFTRSKILEWTSLLRGTYKENPDKIHWNRLYHDTHLMAISADEKGTLLLHEACHQGKLDLVKAITTSSLFQVSTLVKCPMKIRATCSHLPVDNLEFTGVGAAALGGHKETFDYLLDLGMTPCWSDIIAAMIAPCWEFSRYMVEKLMPCLPLLANENVADALLVGAYAGHPDIVLWLLSNTTLEEEVLRDSFKAAVANGNERVAEAIIKFCNENQAYYACLHPAENLLVSAKKGLWNVTTALLGFITEYVDLGSQDQLGKTVLHYAAIQGNSRMIYTFLGKVDILIKENEVAAKSAVLKNLVNTVDSSKRPAVWYASRRNHQNAVCALLTYGASLGSFGILAMMPKSENSARLHKIEQERGGRSDEIYMVINRSLPSHQLKDKSDSQKVNSSTEDMAETSALLDALHKCSVLARNMDLPIFHVACSLGLTNVMDHIMQQRPLLCLNEISENVSPLSCAIVNGQMDIVQKLSDLGASISGYIHLEAWLLLHGKQMFRLVHQNHCKENQEVRTWSIIRHSQHVKRNVSRIFHLNTVHRKYMLLNSRSQSNRPHHRRQWFDLLDSIIQQRAAQDYSPEQRKMILILTSIIGDPQVTQKIFKEWPELYGEWMYKYMDNLEIPITFPDIMLSLHHRGVAERNILCLREVIRNLKVYPTTAIFAYSRGIAAFGSLKWDMCSAGQNSDIRTFTVKLVLESLLCGLHASSRGPFMTSVKALAQDKENIGLSLSERECILNALLHKSVRCKAGDAVGCLLKLGADPLAYAGSSVQNGKTFHSLFQVLMPDWNAFHWAAYSGSLEALSTMQRTIAATDKIFLNKLNESQLGTELVYIACARGKLEIIEWLSNLGMIIREIRSHGRNSLPKGLLLDESSPLRTSLLNGHGLTALWLLKNGKCIEAERNISEQSNVNLYHYAAMLRNQEQAKEIIEIARSFDESGLNSLDEHQQSPTRYAQLFGNLQTLTHLTDNGATLSQNEAFNQVTDVSFIPHGVLQHHLNLSCVPLNKVPVRSSIDESDLDVLRECLKKGQDDLSVWHITFIAPALREVYQWTDVYLLSAIKFASLTGCVRSLDLLLDHYNSRHEPTKQAIVFDSLVTSIKQGHITCIKYLIKLENIDFKTAKTWDSQNVLHLAVSTGNVKAVDSILSLLSIELRELLLHQEDVYGLTPLAIGKSMVGLEKHLSRYVRVEPPTSSPWWTQITSRDELIRELGHKDFEDIVDLFKLCHDRQTGNNIPSLQDIVHHVVLRRENKFARNLVQELKEMGVDFSAIIFEQNTLTENAFALGQQSLAVWLCRNLRNQLPRDGILCSTISEMPGYDISRITNELENVIELSYKHPVSHSQRRSYADDGNMPNNDDYMRQMAEVEEKRIRDITIPRLEDKIQTLPYKTQVEIIMDWGSFRLKEGSPIAAWDRAFQYYEAFHHSTSGVPYAGLGPVIDECQYYIKTIEDNIGRSHLSSIKFCDLKKITIRKGFSNVAEHRGIEEGHIVWQFEIEDGRIKFDRMALPFWKDLRCLFQLSLCWRNVLSQFWPKPENDTLEIIISIDWESIHTSLPEEKPEKLIQRELTDELCSLAVTYNSQLHLHQHFNELRVSCTKSGQGHVAALNNSVLDLQLNLIPPDSTCNMWKVGQLNYQDFFDALSVNQFYLSFDMHDLQNSTGNIEGRTFSERQILPNEMIPIFTLSPEHAKDMIRMTLRSLEGPSLIMSHLLKTKDEIVKTIHGQILSALIKLQTGVYMCDIIQFANLKVGVNAIFIEGKTLRVIDDDLVEVLSSQLPTSIQYHWKCARKELGIRQGVFHVDLEDMIKNGRPFILNHTFNLETEWSLQNAACHEIPPAILKDQCNLQMALLLEETLTPIWELARGMSATVHGVEVRELLLHLKERSETRSAVIEKLQSLIQMLKNAKEIKAFEEAVTLESQIDNSEERWQRYVIRIVKKAANAPPHHKLKDHAENYKILRHKTVGEEKVRFERTIQDRNMSPCKCTLHTRDEKIHGIFGIVTETTKNKEFYIELKDANGIKTRLEAIPNLQIGIFDSSAKLFKINHVKVTFAEEENTSSMIKCDTGCELQKAMATSTERTFSMVVMLEGIPISGSPFPILRLPSNNYLIYSVPVQGADYSQPYNIKVGICYWTALLLKHRNKCDGSINHTPRAFLWKKAKGKLNRRIQKAFGICLFSSQPKTIFVYKMAQGRYWIGIQPKKTSMLDLEAYCNSCREPLRFLTPRNYESPCPPNHLSFKVTSGPPDVRYSKVVTLDDEGLPTSPASNSTLKAGECARLHYQLRDSGGNISGLKVLNDDGRFEVATFTLVSQSVADIRVYARSVNEEHGIIELKTDPLTTMGEYELHMNGQSCHSNGKYHIMVEHGQVQAAQCEVQVKGEFIAESGITNKFFVVLRDSFRNKVPGVNLQVIFSPNVATPVIKCISGRFQCSYLVDRSWQTDFTMSVIYDGTHLPGSPFKVKYKKESYRRSYDTLRNYLNGLRPYSGTTELYINRDSVLTDSFRAFTSANPDDIYYKTHVVFADELGSDWGGLTREWYQLLFKDIFNPGYALFERLDSGHYKPNHCSAVQENHLGYFYFIGRIIAKAMIDGFSLEIYMLPSFYKFLLNQPTDHTDLEFEDATMFRALKDILTYTTNEEMEALCMTFVIEEQELGTIKSTELKSDGENVDVTLENRQEFVQLYTKHVCFARTKDQMRNIKEGFDSVVPLTKLSPFTPEEFEFILCGESTIDLQKLKRHTVYMGYSASSKPVEWLWTLLESWDQDLLKKFLQFISGSKRIPVYTRGWDIQIDRDGRKEMLPTASTCFNRLHLPNYDTEEKLRIKVKAAVEFGSEGFGFM